MNRRVSNVLHGHLKDHSSEVHNSLSPVTRFLNVFAIIAINSNVDRDDCSSVLYVSKTIFTFSILGALNIFSLYYKNVILYKNISIDQSIQITDTVQIIYDSFQYFVDLWFIYKCGSKTSQEYFKRYEQIDTVLDMIHYATIKRELIKLLSIFTVIWLVASITDFISWYLNYGWIPPSVYAVAYIFLFIKVLTTLDLSSHVMQIRFRLMIIGDMVYNYYTLMEWRPGFKGTYNRNNWKISGSPETIETKRENNIKLRSTDEEHICKETELLTRCYLQLTEQVAFINSIFGFRILLNSLSLLIDITRFTNIAVRILLGTQSMPKESRYFPAASSMMRQMTCVLVLISLVNQCEKAYRQQEAIVTNIDHLLINKSPSDKLRTAMTELHSLIQARPITFSLANFFRLDNSFLVSITSVVVTYTIILVQSVN